MEPIFSGNNTSTQKQEPTKVKPAQTAAGKVARKAAQVSSQPKRIIKKSANKVDTPSVKKALKGVFNDEVKQISAKEQHEMYSKSEETEKFTQEQLAKKWNEYLPRLNDRPNLKTTLSAVPQLQDDYTLILEIDNTIQNDAIDTIRPDLVSWLRKELRNSSINLKTVVTEIAREKVIYSDTEKYEAMAKKNPNLALLRRTLNLDF